MDLQNQIPKGELCWTCGQRFSDLGDLNRHLRRNGDNCVCCKCGNEFKFGQGCQHPVHQLDATQSSCNEGGESRMGTLSPCVIRLAENSTKGMSCGGNAGSGKSSTPTDNLEECSQEYSLQNKMSAGCAIQQLPPEGEERKSYDESDPALCAASCSTTSSPTIIFLKTDRHEARKTNEASKSSPVTFNCIFCEKVFNTQHDLDRHQQREKENVVCCVCGEILSVPDTVQHSETHRNENQFSSALHGESLSNESYLKEHKSSHKGKKPYLCTACLKIFVSESYLKIHSKSCRESRPYTCTVCDKLFKQKIDLDRHAKTHTEEKPFPCQQCDKSFRLKHHLVNHLKTHAEKRPFICEHCGKSFKMKHHLMKHLKTHRGERTSECDNTSEKSDTVRDGEELCPSINRHTTEDLSVKEDIAPSTDFRSGISMLFIPAIIAIICIAPFMIMTHLKNCTKRSHPD